jgi:hypothetical protein
VVEAARDQDAVASQYGADRDLARRFGAARLGDRQAHPRLVKIGRCHAS